MHASDRRRSIRPFKVLRAVLVQRCSPACLPASTAVHPGEEMPSTDLCSRPTFRGQTLREHIWCKEAQRTRRGEEPRDMAQSVFSHSDVKLSPQEEKKKS